ncbi:MAG: toxin-antitoxin system HicB family antitoxin [Candidatus Rickettsiella isopodorum]
MQKEKFKYPIEVFWSEEDEGYIATVPDLAGCSAWGATEEDAVHEIHDAAKAWVKAATKAGRTVPEPSTQTHYSGKFLMRLPKRLHADLARSAKVQGVSLNQYVLYLLTEKHSGLYQH